MNRLILFVFMIGLSYGASIKTDKPFVGVRHYHSLYTMPRPLSVHVVEFDLTAPGISFRVRPSGPAPNENSLKTVKNFLNEQHQSRSDARVAINGSFFGSDTNGVVSNSGLVASDGAAYSSFDSWDGLPWPAVHISQNNIPTLLQRPSPSYFGYEASPQTNLYNCISGSEIIISNGVNVANHPGYPGDPFSIHPRTAVGFAPNKVFFVTVDGRQTGVSEGVTTSELADLLIGFGVMNAVNLDGGGSTTLAFADPVSRVVNVPMSAWNSASSERAVAASWAAFAQDYTADQGSWCIISDFENLDQNTFSQTPTASGSTYGIGPSSYANAVTLGGYKSSGCQKLNIIDNPAISGGWFLRHLSGSQASRSQNRICPTQGYVGFYAKTNSSGITAAVAIDNSDNVTADRGILKPILGDGNWHLYEWNLEDSSQWEAWANGDGIINTPDFTIDSIQFYGPDSDCVIYLDTIAHHSTGSIQDIEMPESGVVDAAFISEPFDAWPNGGTGWSGNWVSNPAINNVSFGSASPIKNGSSYLVYQTLVTGGNGVYRDFEGETAGGVYTVQLDVRVDTLGNFFGGSDLSDRIQIFGDTASATADSGSSSSFIIMATPNTALDNWYVYDGRQNGVWSSSYLLNTGIAVVQGGVYSFTITVYPSTLTYDVKIDKGTTVYTRSGLRFRASPTVDASDRLNFGNKIRSSGGTLLQLSYDSIRIFADGAQHPQPANNQTQVLSTNPVLSWEKGLAVSSDPNVKDPIPNPAITGHYVYLSAANDTNLSATPALVTAASYAVPVNLQKGAVYYWRVDESLGASGPGDTPNILKGVVWSFTTEASAPEVDAGQHVIAWLQAGTAAVGLDGTIVWHSSQTAIAWSVVSQPTGAVVQFSNAAIEDPIVTMDTVGTYVVKLWAKDSKNTTGEDMVEIHVYADSCLAARSVPDYQPILSDLNADCKVDMNDITFLAAEWLEKNLLLDNYLY